MASIPTLLAFLFLSHLVLLHSVEDHYNSHIVCPSSFECENLSMGSFHFPFTNSTFPECGLMVDKCDEAPVVQLMEGRSYPVKRINYERHIIEIHDEELQHHLSSKDCDNTFKNLTLPNLPFISFTILNNHTFFKCNNPQFTQPIRDYEYYNCTRYSVYYNIDESNSKKQIPEVLQHNCAPIPLPVSFQPQTVDNPFQLLNSYIHLIWFPSSGCIDCHNKGGQCLNVSSGFECGMPKEEKGKNVWILAPGISVTGLLTGIIIFYCYRRRSSSGKLMIFWNKKSDKHERIEFFLKNEGFLAQKRYSYSDIKKMTNSFKYKLGQGGYGAVYKGKLQNGILVAVKVLNDSKGNGEEFINEVASISRTSHDIVTLLGFCFDGSKRALIYEFMFNGSLEKFIYDRTSSKQCQLGWEMFYQIVVGIAQGLDYLHRGCNTRILHFDIKPHNILLDEDFCPKISDFGLSKLCPKKESIISMSGARGTAGYIAPEVFSRNFGGISHKSDVYSYGMMVLEMVGGRKNIDVEVDHTSEIYFPHWIYNRVELDEDFGLHGIMNEEENVKVKKMIIVGLWCIQTDPSNQPSINKVMEMLEGNLESLQIPPKPFLSSPSRSRTESSTIQIM